MEATELLPKGQGAPHPPPGARTPVLAHGESAALYHQLAQVRAAQSVGRSTGSVGRSTASAFSTRPCPTHRTTLTRSHLWPGSSLASAQHCASVLFHSLPSCPLSAGHRPPRELGEGPKGVTRPASEAPPARQGPWKPNTGSGHCWFPGVRNSRGSSEKHSGNVPCW